MRDDPSARSSRADASTRMPSRRPDALILAAGEGRRMGTPKATLCWRGKTFAEHVVTLAVDAGCPRVTVVWGAAPLDDVAHALVSRGVRDVDWIHNPDFAHGVGTSLRLGLAHVLARRSTERGEAPPSSSHAGTGIELPGVLVLTVDRPHLRLETLEAILAVASARPHAVVQPAQDGRRGHPIVWPLDLARALVGLRDDETPRTLLARADVATRRVTVETDDAAIFEDLTTPEDLSRLP